jgi:MarR family transcriptional regulator for hemolysin
MDDNESMFSRKRNLSWLIYDVSRLLVKSFDRRIKRTGITNAQWRMLTFLSMNQGVSQTELAKRMKLEKAPLGRLIDRLEAAGTVERRPDPNDRRVRRVFLVAEAADFKDDRKIMMEAAGGLTEEALEGISDEDVLKLMDILGRMKLNMAKNSSEKEQEDLQVTTSSG